MNQVFLVLQLEKELSIKYFLISGYLNILDIVFQPLTLPPSRGLSGQPQLPVPCGIHAEQGKIAASTEHLPAPGAWSGFCFALKSLGFLV